MSATIIGMCSPQERVEATTAAYDAVAAEFAERTGGASSNAAAFLELFLSELAPRSLVVDAGSGPGHQANLMALSGHRVVAVDRSHQMAAMVPLPAMAVRADLRQIPVKAGAVDAVWACASLLHVDADDLAGALGEWQRILRPDGVVAIATSINAASGWEAVPASPHRVSELPDGQRRWFVHHDHESLVRGTSALGWSTVHLSVVSGARDWIQYVGRVP